MSKNLLEAAERIAEELSAKERLTLAKELMQQARKAKWNQLFRSIDRKLQGRRCLTMGEIHTEIAAARRAQRHARSSQASGMQTRITEANQ